MNKKARCESRPSWSFTRLGLLIGTPLVVALGVSALSQAEVTLPKTWTSGETLTAADLNSNLATLNRAMVDLTSAQVISGAKTFTSPAFYLRGEQVQQFISSFHPNPQFQSYLFLDRGRGTPTAPAGVLGGDEIGRIYGRAYNAGDMRSTTMIKFVVDGAPGATQVPGAITFHTSDGALAEQERMRITSGGRIGIGTSAPLGSLQVSGFGGWSASNYGTQLIVSTVPNASFPTIGILDQNNANPWAITNAGGALRFSQMPAVGSSAANTLRVEFRADGSTSNSTGTWTTLSDGRLKHEIRPIADALDTVTQLQGVSFRWKDARKDREMGRIEGFIAQQVEQVKPAWVRVGPEGNRELQTVGMDAILVEAMKEQQRQIETLRRENRRLQERLVRIESALGGHAGAVRGRRLAPTR